MLEWLQIDIFVKLNTTKDFMNKINSLLITASLLTLSHVGFAAQTDNDRYQAIIAAYSAETNSFESGFAITIIDDCITVANHRGNLEAKLDRYKASWMPALLKTIGIGFGIDAGISAIRAIISPLSYDIRKPVSDALVYPTLAIYPLLSARAELTNPITYTLNKELNDMYFKKDTISATTWKIGKASVPAAVSLFSAAIATYLFKKANSYKKEIKHLEKSIELDTTILKLLLS